MFGSKCHESAEYLLLDATLRTTENVITYRRRYRSHLQLQTVLDLLLLDATNPRSLTYQLDRLQTHIALLPRPKAAYRLSEEERLILDASTRLRLVDTAELAATNGDQYTRQNLDDFLADSVQPAQPTVADTDPVLLHPCSCAAPVAGLGCQPTGDRHGRSSRNSMAGQSQSQIKRA